MLMDIAIRVWGRRKSDLKDRDGGVRNPAADIPAKQPSPDGHMEISIWLFGDGCKGRDKSFAACCVAN